MNGTLKKGDAYELIQYIPDNSIDLVLTDPPYEIDYTTKEIKGLAINKVQSMLANHADTLVKGIDMAILEEFLRILKRTKMYIFCSKKQLPKYLSWAESKGLDYEILIYHKFNPPPMCANAYLKDKEYCVYIHEDGIVIDSENGHPGTVFGPYYMPLPESHLYNHPTIKPMDMITGIIANSTKENDIVLDPFMGSGTTALACEYTGRKWLGFEIDDEFYGVCMNRLQGITVKDSVNGYEQMKLGI